MINLKVMDSIKYNKKVKTKTKSEVFFLDSVCMIEQKQIQGLVRLCCNPVKEYAWGSIDTACIVGRFRDQKKQYGCYAELWMGIHPHGESSVTTSSSPNSILPLSSYLSKNNLTNPTYLSKLLSIQKCLSIQTHPTRQQAQKLHKEDPQAYSDPNDKPQMFYTLSKFQCFLGYINKEELHRIFRLGIFQQFLTTKQIETPRDAILGVLGLGLQEQVKLLEICKQRIIEIHPKRYGVGGWVQKILKDFSDDIGIVISFFLEYRVFEPRVCCYIQCNTPHAYIHGQCLEIMKNSDNVCRLGLTPKFKDLKIISQVLGTNLSPISQIPPQLHTQDSYLHLLYSSNSLNISILTHSPTQNSKLHQSYTLPSSPYIRMSIVLKGSFEIRQISQTKDTSQNEQCQQGSIILLLPHLQYQVTNSEINTIGESVLCISWAQF